jgi:hypothetical protein
MNYIQTLDKLINNLQKSSQVNSHDIVNEKESVRLAHAIIDLSESFKEILENLAPKLNTDNIEEKEVEDILLNIGEELRHILYHIKDCRYYDYISIQN